MLSILTVGRSRVTRLCICMIKQKSITLAVSNARETAGPAWRWPRPGTVGFNMTCHIIFDPMPGQPPGPGTPAAGACRTRAPPHPPSTPHSRSAAPSGPGPPLRIPATAATAPNNTNNNNSYAVMRKWATSGLPGRPAATAPPPQHLA